MYRNHVIAHLLTAYLLGIMKRRRYLWKWKNSYIFPYLYPAVAVQKKIQSTLHGYFIRLLIFSFPCGKPGECECYNTFDFHHISQPESQLYAVWVRPTSSMLDIQSHTFWYHWRTAYNLSKSLESLEKWKWKPKSSILQMAPLSCVLWKTLI